MSADLELRCVPGKGRGVFARRKFSSGEIVEQCPVIVLPDEQFRAVEQTALRDYYFDWGAHAAIPGGYAMFYNHSSTPNVSLLRNVDTGELTIVALCDIEPGEEMCHTYACDPWFPVAA